MTTLNPDGSVMWPRVCEAGGCAPPLGLNVTPHTDVLAANAGQLNNGGCFKASKMVIWTARQGCVCYQPQATNCTGVVGAGEELAGHKAEWPSIAGETRPGRRLQGGEGARRPQGEEALLLRLRRRLELRRLLGWWWV